MSLEPIITGVLEKHHELALRNRGWLCVDVDGVPCDEFAIHASNTFIVPRSEHRAHVAAAMIEALAGVVVLPEPSGPVAWHGDYWKCGAVMADDLAIAESHVATLAQNLANYRAIAAHMRAQPTVPSLAEDVERLYRWGTGWRGETADALVRVLAAVESGAEK